MAAVNLSGHVFDAITQKCKHCSISVREHRASRQACHPKILNPSGSVVVEPPEVQTRTRVWITTSFEALHYWSDAPREVEFLRHPHRHVFHVKMWWNVSHDDRQIEFILKKREVDAFIREMFEDQTSYRSCEHFARELMTQFWACGVEVSEDGENGAVVEVIQGNV